MASTLARSTSATTLPRSWRTRTRRHPLSQRFIRATKGLWRYQVRTVYQPLPSQAPVIFLLATHGEGEPTDNTAAFYKFIEEERCDNLKSLKFASFALGSRGPRRRLLNAYNGSC